jgi:hypothetical protein
VRVWAFIYLCWDCVFSLWPLCLVARKFLHSLALRSIIDLWTEPLSEHTKLVLHLLWLLCYLQGKVVVPGMYLVGCGA